VLGASFTKLADGTRLRNVTIRVMSKLPGGHGDASPVTIFCSTSAEPFDRLLNRLGIALAAVGAAGGLVAAGVAVRVSRVALRPLRDTARQIGEIDERALDRRIDPTPLPPELLPMAERLNEMLARLERAFQQRQRFLADASHELRTPVAALLTAMQISLRHPRDADAYRKTLETCTDDAAYLRRLVERLMEQVRSDLPETGEPVEPVDAGRLLEQCAAVVEPLANAKGVAFHHEIAPALSARTWLTQPIRVRSIAVNLLSNAVEYTPPAGKVDFTASLNDGLLLRVSDTGPGIASDHLPHLFEPFYRADKSRAREAGHLGLGLALVQAHVHALGGKCSVQSQLGKGTTFEVYLPYEAYEAAKPVNVPQGIA
jgi:signal transduction histidine kinase